MYYFQVQFASRTDLVVSVSDDEGAGSLPDFVEADEESAIDEVKVTEVVQAAMLVMCPTFLMKAEKKSS